jgi:hypothetical protein
MTCPEFGRTELEVDRARVLSVSAMLHESPMRTYNRCRLLIADGLQPSIRINRQDLGVQPRRQRRAEDMQIFRIIVELCRDRDEASPEAAGVSGPD